MARTENEQTEERGAPAPALMEPDTILPVQFAAAFRNAKGWVEGEKRLVAAVLTDAVECYMKHVQATDPRSHQLFVDAEAWIFDDTAGGLFSFRGTCEVLGMEPEYVRRGLSEWRKQLRASYAPSRRSDDAEEYPPLKAAG